MWSAPANAGETAATTRPPPIRAIGTTREREQRFIGRPRVIGGLTSPCRNRAVHGFIEVSCRRREPSRTPITTGRHRAAIGCRPREEASMTIAFRGVRRASCATVAAFSLLCVAHASSATAAGATPTVPSGNAVAVDTGAGNQTDPHIAGTLTAYTDDGSATLRIHYRDSTSGADGLVPISDTGQDALPDVSGTVISYVHFAACRASVWTSNPATGASPAELDPQ